MQKILIIFLSLAALAGGIFAQRWFFSVDANPSELDIAFPDLDGKPHVMSEWKGKILIVNFWATWCPPCVEEMPEFVKLQNELGSRGVQFVGILLDDEVDAARAFLQARPVNYPILDGSIGGRQWSANLGDKSEVLPFSVVFDTSGKRVHTEAGRFTREEVLEQVGKLLSVELTMSPF